MRFLLNYIYWLILFMVPKYVELRKIHIHPDFGLTIEQFLTKYKYPLESHMIISKDGYISTAHRIPNGRNKFNQTGNNSKPGVILFHGLYGQSFNFISTGPQNSLALQLADLEYDVWLLNARGNLWSRQHVYLNPNDYSQRYWDFSFHEMGYYDLPASIDYILNITQRQNITYVGLSAGTTISIVLTSTRPEYNQKLNLIVALAPVVYFEHLSGSLAPILKHNEILITMILRILNIQEVPHLQEVDNILKFLCNDDSMLQNLCEDLIFLASGFDYSQMNKSIVPIIISNILSGGSTKIFLHYLQYSGSKYFRQFDYGYLGNVEKYGQTTPPEYNLSLITAPFALYHAKNDFLSAIEDVIRLAKDLPNLVEKKLIEFDKFNHVDFVTATDINKLLYNYVISLINRFNYY